MTPQGHIPPSATPGAHEHAEADARAIFRTALVIGLILVALILMLLLFFRVLEQLYPARTSEAAPRVTMADLPPTPRLQIDPRADLAAVRAKEDLHLTHYGWVDRQLGIAQIPIDRAMALWLRNYAAAPVPLTPTGPGSVPPSAPVTELQMRQQKAQEGPDAP